MKHFFSRMPAFAGMTAVMFSLIVLSSCIQQEWKGFIYPDRSNLTIDEEVGTFNTLDECRSNVIKTAKEKRYENYDYECGLNCKGIEKPYICEKTER